jgi:hypothetical protein
LNITLVFREAGDGETGVNFWQVYGRPKQIAELKAAFDPVLTNASIANESFSDYAFVVFKSEADWYDLSTFWVTIVVVIIFLSFVIAAFVVWHCDDYSKDPQNSLLFVTEGNRIVTGE